MKNRLASLSSMSSSEILNIHEPEKIFSGDKALLKKEYRHLAMIWHPDRRRKRDATKVFPHINSLFTSAMEKLNSNIRSAPGLTTLIDKTGRTFRFRFHKRCVFELGEMMVGDSYMAYVVESDHKAYFDNAVRKIGNFTYASNVMKTEVSRYLPEILKVFETSDNCHVLVLKKEKDLIRLRDILDHFKNSVYPAQWPRHAAWIQSTLHNLSCYLDYAGLTHNDISPDTYFISPANHSGSLLGGWWYAERTGQQLKGVPLRTYNLMSMDITGNRTANPRTDLELIRAVGRELLGDAEGMSLSRTGKAPETMTSWLRLPSTGDAVTDYRLWRKSVLIDSFGRPRFVELNLRPEDVYPVCPDF